MIRSVLPLGVALLSASAVVAQQATCALGSPCPEDQPCCSQYGECGVGAYCLGGCDPRMSFSVDSCVPEPVCQSRVMPMTDTKRIVDINKYFGDPTDYDWVSQGEAVAYNGSVLLTMPANSVGTVLASTVYIWYGNIKGRFKTSRGAGVVTAFILLSDVKDEIDYEFVGTELTTAQTNYYFQGFPYYDNSANITLSDTYDNWHDYEIQWTPESITWLVDGQVGRTKNKADTWNATGNQWSFPQTPARLQLSIWPGGASSNAQGTITWAGGPINWNSQDIQDYGYDFATFGEVVIECYNASSSPGTNSGVSYTYDSTRATNDTVIDGDKPTVLASFLGTGTDMDAGASNSTSSGSSPSASVNTIPGGSAEGPGQADGSGSSDSSGSSGSSGTASAATCTATGFTQNCGSSGGGKSDGVRALGQERLLRTSVFGMVIAVAALMWL